MASDAPHPTQWLFPCCPTQEKLARGRRDYVEQVFDGRLPEGGRPLAEVVGEGKVSLDQFAHFSALVGGGVETKWWGARSTPTHT